MVWARLDDSILDNPKIARVGVLGFALHVAAITWCARNLTDGFIPEARVGGLVYLESVLEHDPNQDRLMGPDESPRGFHITAWYVAESLVKAGLWHEVEGGYQIHDYLVYNPSKEEVARAKGEKSQAKSEAGKKGAKKRWGDRAKSAQSVPPVAIALPSESMAKPMADAWQKDGPDPGPDPDPREGIPQTPLRGESEKEPERASGVVEFSPAPFRASVSPSDDGCFGAAFQAWCDGVGEATRKPFAPPRGGAANAIVDAIRVHEPVIANRVSWAKQRAKEWVAFRKAKGLDLNPFKFGEWLNSPAAPQDVNPYDGPWIRAERERRERDRRHTEANAVPAPIEDLMAAIGGGRKT